MSLAMKTLLLVALISLSLEGCCNSKLVGLDLDTGTSTGGSGTGSTTSTGGASSTSTSSSGTSTGGASSTSTSSNTTGGSSSGAGACMGTGSSLQSYEGSPPNQGDPATNMSNSADFNGDGLLDLALTGGAGTAIWIDVFLGLADGGLSDPIVFPGDMGPDGELGPLTAADVNGDGRPDILCWGQNGIDLMLNVDGGLTAPRLLIAQDITVTSGSISALAVGDLNQDGIPDIVEGLAGGGGPNTFVVNTFLGLRDGGFSKAIPVATQIAAEDTLAPGTLFLSDLNLDGYPDIVAAPTHGIQLTVLLHLADGGYQRSSYALPSPNIIVAARPVPRPGAGPDLVVTYYDTGGSGFNNSMHLLLNAGDGTFSNGPSYGINTLVPAGLAVADFNGDCLPDVAVANTGCWDPGAPGDDVLVFFGLPDGGFGQPQSLPREGSGLFLAPMGLVSSPRALAADVACGTGAIEVFGDASSQ